ncbi:hypothetical protein [Mycetohabitans rhizoxinica]|uniref:hypothetical protein n=1 Tax=Mycetohabitans rhizoxinica TaxID=412963 RepID=UPI0030D2AA00
MITVECTQDSGSTVPDNHGDYSAALNAIPPCVLTLTSDSMTLHSLAFAGGTFLSTSIRRLN